MQPPPYAGPHGYPSPYGYAPPHGAYGGYPTPYGPYGGYPPPYGPPVPPGVGLPRPVAVASMPGTPYALALVEVAPTVSGPAVASLVTGIASIVVSFAVALFAGLGAGAGWGARVAGAFAILAALLCTAAVALYRAAVRRIGRSAAWGATRGRGLAVAGLVCGLVGLGLTVLVMLFAL